MSWLGSELVTLGEEFIKERINALLGSIELG